MESEVPLLERPYAQRRLIVVVDDAAAEVERQVLYEAQRQAQHQAVQDGDTVQEGINWAKVAKAAMEAPLILFGGYGAKIIVEAVQEQLKSTNELRDRGVPVLTVARSEAANLTFPVGHPRDGVLYAGHPAVPNVYYTAALFHRLTFEHKFSEAVQILMALGATQFEVEHVTGWSSQFAASLNVPLPTAGVQAGAEVGGSRASTSQILYTATLSGTEHPALPENLVWYPYEPTWKQIVDGRLKYGLQDFSLTVRYEEDFGINAGLKLSVQQVGIDLGGKFEDHQPTIWRISGKFAG